MTLSAIGRLSAELTAVQGLSAEIQNVEAVSAELADTGELSATLAAVGGMTAALSGTGALSATLSISATQTYSTYTGAYEVTPTTDTQTLSTEDLLMTANVVVNPIPSNYGLITWDGSTLTVS